MEPAVSKVYVVGADEDQDELLLDGVLDDSVRRYPVTALLSVAVKVLMDIVKEEDVDGISKAVITGLVLSLLLDPPPPPPPPPLVVVVVVVLLQGRPVIVLNPVFEVQPREYVVDDD